MAGIVCFSSFFIKMIKMRIQTPFIKILLHWEITKIYFFISLSIISFDIY